MRVGGLRTSWVQAGLVACALLAVGMRGAHGRDARRRRLRAERDALDDSVARRTEELVRLASHLQNSREDERAKLARELHDELGAVLTAAKLDVAWLGAKLKEHDPSLRDRLQALKSVLEDAIHLKRRIIEDLRPSLLTNLGLVPALQRLIEDQRERFDGNLRADIDPSVDVPESIALVIYRIAQEALTNVRKHADASRIDVTLRCLPKHLELRVRDDGAGFDPSAVGAAHHGLVGMRHRLLSIRGALEVDSAPGHGTAITALIPASEIEAARAHETSGSPDMADEAPPPVSAEPPARDDRPGSACAPGAAAAVTA